MKGIGINLKYLEIFWLFVRYSVAWGGTWVFFGWVCAARDSRIVTRF